MKYFTQVYIQLLQYTNIKNVLVIFDTNLVVFILQAGFIKEHAPLKQGDSPSNELIYEIFESI